MTDPISDEFRDWATQIEANPAYVDALVTEALANLTAQLTAFRTIDSQIAAKTTERNTVRSQKDQAEQRLVDYLGEDRTIQVTTTAGSQTATGSFDGLQGIQGGWIQSGFVFKAGTIITDWSPTQIGLSQAANNSGSFTANVKTGSLAVTDAQIARLTKQANDLQAQLDAISDGNTVLTQISEGRAALVAQHHHLAPRTILTSAITIGSPLTADMTEELNTWSDSLPDGGDPFQPTFGHLWRNRVYRCDGTWQFSATDTRVDFHDSRLTAGAVGAASRVHVNVLDCTRFRLLRPTIRGSLPAGAPTFNNTYSGGQHGIQILGGTGIYVDRADISDVYGSGIRVASQAGTKPVTVVIQGVGSVGRCGNHAFALAAADGVDWTTTSMGATGRETIGIVVATGVTCATVDLHDFTINGAETDPAYRSITARGAGRCTNLTFQNITATATHGAITADIAVTGGTAGTNLVIDGNSGPGALLNAQRAAWEVTNYAGLTYTNNTQNFGKSGGVDVMYGAKGTTITGTITVSGNTHANSVNQALINGVGYPPVSTLAITGPASVPVLTEDAAMTPVVFSASGGTPPYTWTWGPHFLSSLPPGLTFTDTGNTGTLAGTPTTVDSHSVDITVTDSVGSAVTEQRAISIVAAGVYSINSPTITSLSLTRNVAMTDVPFTVQNNTGATTWSITSGTLPPGVSWTTVGGVRKLHGTPTTNQAAASVTFRADDSDADFDTHTISFTVASVSANPLRGGMSIGMGDHSSNRTDYQRFMAHIKTRRQALVGNQNHNLVAVRIDLQWPGWEGNARGTRDPSLGGKLSLINEIVAEGMVPLCGAWFVPKWAQRRDIIGIPNMQGTIVSSNATESVLRFDHNIPKGDYGGMSITGNGIPAGKKHRDGKVNGVEIGFLPNSLQGTPRDFLIAGGGCTVGASGTYQIGGQTNNSPDGRLPIDPSHYEHAFESFQWLAQQLNHITSPVMFELSNEGNFIPYSKPRGYPEMFCRAQMYQYAGIIAGSGANYANRSVIPAGCAAFPHQGPTSDPYGGFNYPDFTSGPNYASPVQFYRRYLDEMVRLQPTWAAYRTAKNLEAKTHTHVFCTDYGTHTYTHPYRVSGLGYAPNTDNLMKPGDANFKNFDDDPPGIHNLGMAKPEPYRSVFRNWLVHLTENGPGWGEANGANGVKCDVGAGFDFGDPSARVDLVHEVTTKNNGNPNGSGTSLARSILHPHEGFVYTMRINEAINFTTNAQWMGLNWDCGEVMVGIWSQFRGFGTILDDPLHQTLASWFMWDPNQIESPPLPTRFRTKLNPVIVRGEITRTSGPRTGPMNSYYTAKLGYSPIDALAVL